MRILKRAGLEPWPRLFHAMRASRETELVREHPIHVVTAWLGNTPQIAMKHYLMVTETDFSKAIGKLVDMALQNPVQCSAKPGANSGAAASRDGSHDRKRSVDPFPRLFLAEAWSAVVAERVKVDLFSGEVGATVAVLFAPPLRLPYVDPIGGPVTGPPEAAGVHKTLQ